MTRRICLQDLADRVAVEHIPVEVHSGKLTPGSVFVVMPAAVPKGRTGCVPGGEQHLGEALRACPAAVVCRAQHLSLLKELGIACPVAVVENTRSALGVLAQKYYGTDERCPTIVGITGTNGKTTETYLLEALFNALGRKTGIVGTISYRWPGHEEEAPLTTPGCLALHSMLARMYAAGAEYAFMEVSSHALDQERVAGIRFSAALLTNLTQDHLDYHNNMEEYFAAKSLLFLPGFEGGGCCDGKLGVVNADDIFGRRLLERKPGSIGFGLEDSGFPPVPGSRHLFGRILSSSPQGVNMVMRFEGKTWELSSPLVGAFNVMNLLGAQAMGLALGLVPEDFSALENFSGVKGRLERIANKKGLNVFVDYAHTPDALRKVLSALRAAGFARIVTVFGCGGNRDRGKRSLMGRAVAELTDIAILTSDNPRNEDPEAIMEDVMPGLASCKRVVTQPDRRLALAAALELIGSDDALLVAGKGHESYQLIRGVKYPFSDQAVLGDLLQ